MSRSVPCRLLILVLGLVLGPLAPAPAAEALSLRARSAGAFDLATGTWLHEKGIDELRPVASISKVAAALTFRELVPDLDVLVTIRREDWTGAGRTRLRVGDRVPARTLLRLALVASDNCAARALAHPAALSPEAFAYRMTLTARRLGCRDTRFTEPTGLSEENVSTVREVVTLFRAALADPVLREMLGTDSFVLETGRGPRTIVHSSNMLRYREEVRAAKTGYIDEAGYCLVQLVRDPGRDYITVVLGTPSRRNRSVQSLRLMEHVRGLGGGGS